MFSLRGLNWGCSNVCGAGRPSGRSGRAETFMSSGNRFVNSNIYFPLLLSHKMMQTLSHKTRLCTAWIDALNFEILTVTLLAFHVLHRISNFLISVLWISHVYETESRWITQKKGECWKQRKMFERGCRSRKLHQQRYELMGQCVYCTHLLWAAGFLLDNRVQQWPSLVEFGADWNRTQRLGRLWLTTEWMRYMQWDRFEARMRLLCVLHVSTTAWRLSGDRDGVMCETQHFDVVAENGHSHTTVQLRTRCPAEKRTERGLFVFKTDI